MIRCTGLWIFRLDDFGKLQIAPFSDSELCFGNCVVVGEIHVSRSSLKFHMGPKLTTADVGGILDMF